MQPFEPLEYGSYYHIYNHSVGERDLFDETANYEYFLLLYNRYISMVAETYAWVLMKNHFHFLVRIKDEEEINKINPDRVPNPVRVTNQFSKLFNAYAQAFNKYYHTHGALFERPFQRKRADTKEYLERLVLYIHNNPNHHGICSHPDDYPWSSYSAFVSGKPTELQREAVIGWFGGEASFIARHNEGLNWKEMNDWLGLG